MKCLNCGQEYSTLKQSKLFLLYYINGVHIGMCGKCCEKDYKDNFTSRIIWVISTAVMGGIVFAWLVLYGPKN